MKFHSTTALLITVAVVSGCAVQTTPIPRYAVIHSTPIPTVLNAPSTDVVRVYLEPPLEQPDPIMVACVKIE